MRQLANCTVEATSFEAALESVLPKLREEGLQVVRVEVDEVGLALTVHSIDQKTAGDINIYRRFLLGIKKLLIISYAGLDSEFLIGYFFEVYMLIISHNIIQVNKKVLRMARL